MTTFVYPNVVSIFITNPFIMRYYAIFISLALVPFASFCQKKMRVNVSAGYLPNTSLSLGLSLKGSGGLGAYFSTYGLGRLTPLGEGDGINFTAIADTTKYSSTFNEEFYSMVIGTNTSLNKLISTTGILNNVSLNIGLGWKTTWIIEDVQRFHIWESSKIPNEFSYFSRMVDKNTILVYEIGTTISFGDETLSYPFIIEFGYNNAIRFYARIGIGIFADTR